MNKNENTTQSYTIDELCTIIQNLRGPFGCPWDQKQTHESLRTGMLEEAAEATAAIKYFDKTGNADALKEELGDVLLQVVMQAQIAKEEGLFTFDDVVEGISTKMIRRHPHVFYEDGKPLNGATQEPGKIKSWAEIKAIENLSKTYHELPRQKKWRKIVVKVIDFLL